MPADFYESFTSEPGSREHVVQFVGGSAAVTKSFGKGITTTYISTGVVDLTWSANEARPGTYVGPKALAFHATTQSGVKGYTVVPGVYNTSTRVLRLNIFDGSNNLVDLAALQWCTLTLLFVVDLIEP